MFINEPIVTSIYTRTQNTAFSTSKHCSENIIFAQPKQNENNADFKSNLDTTQNTAQVVSFDGYYNMFMASQKLKNSEILNKYNHQINIQKYA